MASVKIFKIVAIYSLIELGIFCETYYSELNDVTGLDAIDEKDYEDNSVLDSVYDTMKYNYEMKLQQNLNELNLISDIRNKRNINEPINPNSVDYYKNHQYDVNRKVPSNFPLGFKNPSRLMPIGKPMIPNHRSDYYEEDVLVKYIKFPINQIDCRKV